MEKTIQIGNKEVSFKSSAATNILYKRAFGEDILVKLSSYTKNLKELKRMKDEVDKVKKDETKTDEEILEAMNTMMSSEAFGITQTFANETLPRLAYVMFAEANYKVDEVFKKMNEENYLAWLMTIDQDELLDLTGQVMDIWQAGARTHSKQKN